MRSTTKLTAKSTTRESAKQAFANLHWTCPRCGKELKRIEIEFFGKPMEVPCYGSCGCEESAFDGQDIPHSARRYAKAGIPKRYLDAEWDHFSRTLDVEAGRSVFVYGPNGTGKTTFACALAKQLIDMGVTVRFENSKQVITEIQSTYSGKLTDVLERCYACRVLVLDDLGKEQPTAYALSMLYQVIDERYAAGKPTVVTSNFSRGALVNRWENADLETAEAIVSRLCENCETVEMRGDDRRLA